jgi:hypothetical protein
MQAASVEVNHPKILPPMMMPGVRSAGIETQVERRNSRQVERA